MITSSVTAGKEFLMSPDRPEGQIHYMAGGWIYCIATLSSAAVFPLSDEASYVNGM